MFNGLLKSNLGRYQVPIWLQLRGSVIKERKGSGGWTRAESISNLSDVGEENSWTSCIITLSFQQVEIIHISKVHTNTNFLREIGVREWAEENFITKFLIYLGCGPQTEKEIHSTIKMRSSTWYFCTLVKTYCKINPFEFTTWMRH